jgi:hypothetical protein
VAPRTAAFKASTEVLVAMMKTPAASVGKQAESTVGLSHSGNLRTENGNSLNSRRISWLGRLECADRRYFPALQQNPLPSVRSWPSADRPLRGSFRPTDTLGLVCVANSYTGDRGARWNFADVQTRSRPTRSSNRKAIGRQRFASSTALSLATAMRI